MGSTSERTLSDRFSPLYTLRSLSALRSCAIVFCHIRSPLRSRSDFQSAPLRFPLRSHALSWREREPAADAKKVGSANEETPSWMCRPAWCQWIMKNHSRWLKTWLIWECCQTLRGQYDPLKVIISQWTETFNRCLIIIIIIISPSGPKEPRWAYVSTPRNARSFLDLAISFTPNS